MTASAAGDASSLPPLRLHPGRLAVWRVEQDSPESTATATVPTPGSPAPGSGPPLVAEIRTGSVRTLIAAEPGTGALPEGVAVETGFRAFEVIGPLDFALVGVLAGYLSPLARAEVPVFVLSTFDTDWVLVRESRLPEALEALERAGVEIIRPGDAASPAARRPTPAPP